MAPGLARLREDTFDCVLISHEPPNLDALELLDGLHAGSDDQSVIVLGTASEKQLAALCFEAGADAYVCVHTATTRALVWTVARAIERRRLMAENRRLLQADKHRRELEHEEAHRLLEQQRAIVGPPAQTAATVSEPVHGKLPDELVAHYRELLRTYVIMGSGKLATELERLAGVLVAANISAREAMRLHLQVLEEMIRGLGNRSARHVMNRADMLVLEVLVGLADLQHRQRPSTPTTRRQPWLADFEALATGPGKRLVFVSD